MSDETRVWIARRRNKGRDTYRLRWVDPVAHKVRTKAVGTDRARAERERVIVQSQLDEGSYQSLTRITWDAFVTDHVSKIEGKRNAVEAKRTLIEFGEIVTPKSPKDVTYTMVEAYVAHLREIGNQPATINKKLRYIRAALNRAIRRGHAFKNPMDGDLFRSVEQRPPRIATDEEETALLAAAEALAGFRVRAFVYAALNTGGRRSELCSLTWDRIRLDGDEPQVHFARTKSHKDRLVPINPDLVVLLRRLQAMTLQQGGPFIGIRKKLTGTWKRILDRAGIETLTIHDLRRTYVARLIRAGVPLPSVQKLAGHADIQTTLRYYNWVSDRDLREAVKMLKKDAG